jgi:hypothetical protein
MIEKLLLRVTWVVIFMGPALYPVCFLELTVRGQTTVEKIRGTKEKGSSYFLMQPVLDSRWSQHWSAQWEMLAIH